MSLTTSFEAPVVRPKDRLEALFGELSELAGQRNAIDGRIVEIVAEMDSGSMWGMTGARSIASLVAWKLGCSLRNAQTITAIAGRATEFPRCTAQLRAGRLSLDQVGVIAEKAADGSDEHYVELAESATVSQLNTAIKSEPRPEPPAQPRWAEPKRSVKKTTDEHFTTWHIRLPHEEAVVVDAALSSHQDALIAQWKRDRDAAGASAEDGGKESAVVPPFPTAADAFMRLVGAGWDVDVVERPHGQRTTVVVHLDVEQPAARWHLGPGLTDAERRLITCDATFELLFERDGVPIGAGRSTRQISRRLRRALEYRHRTCAVPGCGATRGLHAHHIRHWEDGGPTELDNLVLLCPYHHRLHHRGVITIVGPADRLMVYDSEGQPLSAASVARPPTRPPPAVPPYPGPTGERAQWKWYTPYEPKPPTTN